MRTGRKFISPLSREENIRLSLQRDGSTPGWVETGEIEVEFQKLYWCPQAERWMECSGSEKCPHTDIRFEAMQWKLLARVEEA